VVYLWWYRLCSFLARRRVGREVFLTAVSLSVHGVLALDSSLTEDGEMGSLDDVSLIACDLDSSWRYCVQSSPIHYPPRPQSVQRRPAVAPSALARPIPVKRLTTQEMSTGFRLQFDHDL